MEGVKHISFFINENNMFSDALTLLKIIRDDWNKDEISIKFLTDGVTNKLLQCTRAETIVLIRINGNATESCINRKAEIKNICLLHTAGLASKLYATFENGLVYEYVPGCALTTNTVNRPEIYKLVAKHMARFHKINPQGDPHSVLWDMMTNFYSLLPDIYSFRDKSKYKSLIPTKSKLLEEIILLKNKLSRLNSPVVFCHNDLQYRNIVYNESANSVAFIDFEYSGFNYQAFDIGNHFAKFVGLENINYENYPSKDLQFAWLRQYLSVYKNVCANEITNNELERLYVQVNQFALTSYMLWGLWSLFQAQYSTIDTDFLECASLRFYEYYSRKDIFLSLQIPECETVTLNGIAVKSEMKNR